MQRYQIARHHLPPAQHPAIEAEAAAQLAATTSRTRHGEARCVRAGAVCWGPLGPGQNKSEGGTAQGIRSQRCKDSADRAAMCLY